jgi:hypothetical protein
MRIPAGKKIRNGSAKKLATAREQSGIAEAIMQRMRNCNQTLIAMLCKKPEREKEAGRKG